MQGILGFQDILKGNTKGNRKQRGKASGVLLGRAPSPVYIYEPSPPLLKFQPVRQRARARSSPSPSRFHKRAEPPPTEI